MQYDSLGTLLENQERVNSKSLVSLRIFVEKIVSEHSNQSIGSILYANSFISIDDENSINLTEPVPNLLQWRTDSHHYLHHPSLDILGAPKNDERKDIEGLMPVKSELQATVKRDLLLIGKFAVF